MVDNQRKNKTVNRTYNEKEFVDNKDNRRENRGENQKRQTKNSIDERNRE